MVVRGVSHLGVSPLWLPAYEVPKDAWVYLSESPTLAIHKIFAIFNLHSSYFLHNNLKYVSNLNLLDLIVISFNFCLGFNP